MGVLQSKGCKKIGIIGAKFLRQGCGSDTAASYYPKISLTIAISPCDFVMEGFYRDGKDGMEERPGDNESTVSWEGKPLPYLPYGLQASGVLAENQRSFESRKRYGCFPPYV